MALTVDYMVLADAVAAVQGKHFIHGAGWDTITGLSFPVIHPAMGVAVRLRVPWVATDRPHDLELDVLNGEEQSILATPPGPLHATVIAGRPPHLAPGEDQVLPLALSLHGLKFERPGLFMVILRLDGREAMRSPFRVSPASGTMTAPR